MQVPDDLWTRAFLGTGGVLGVRWLWQVWRGSKKDFQGDQSESAAIKNLKAEMHRLSERVDELEQKVEVKDKELDEQRSLRRAAEDALDREKRRNASLEDQIVELERDRDAD